MEFLVIRVTAPTETELERFDDVQAALEFTQAQESGELPVGVYHEIRQGDRTLWTSETGQLERLT